MDGTAVGALFLCVGLGFAGVSMPEVLEARRSIAWPTISGTVVSSKIVLQRGRRHRSREREVPVIEYRYEVGGVEHLSRRMFFGDDDLCTWTFGGRSFVDQHPVGCNVTVHHDPADPSSSVVEAGITWAVLVGPGFGAVIAGLGGLVLWATRKGVREARRRHPDLMRQAA